MKEVKQNEIIEKLEELGIETSDTFRIDIRLDKIIVHKYRKNNNGEKFITYDKDGKEVAATEYKVYKITPDVNG